MRVFELIGPIMFGPSSSHTAGACRLSRAMWQIAGCGIVEASLDLHGSFRVKEGANVNKALVAGLMGYDTDDDRINHSHADMEKSGIKFTYQNTVLDGAHNNTVRYHIKGRDFGFTATGASIGGGMIEVTDIGGAKCSVTGDYSTLLIFCKDAKALVGEADALAAANIGAHTIETAVSDDGKTQIVLIKTAQPLTDDAVKKAGELGGAIFASRHLRFE